MFLSAKPDVSSDLPGATSSDLSDSWEHQLSIKETISNENIVAMSSTRIMPAIRAVTSGLRARWHCQVGPLIIYRSASRCAFRYLFQCPSILTECPPIMPQNGSASLHCNRHSSMSEPLQIYSHITRNIRLLLPAARAFFFSFFPHTQELMVRSKMRAWGETWQYTSFVPGG